MILNQAASFSFLIERTKLARGSWNQVFNNVYYKKLVLATLFMVG